jgi:hypothetical protein
MYTRLVLVSALCAASIVIPATKAVPIILDNDGAEISELETSLAAADRWGGVGKFLNGAKKAVADVSNLCITCGCVQERNQKLMTAAPNLDASTTGPWTSLEHLNVAMFMAFVSYNNAINCKLLINNATLNSGAVKAGGFQYAGFFSGKSGVERLLAVGRINRKAPSGLGNLIKNIWGDAVKHWTHATPSPTARTQAPTERPWDEYVVVAYRGTTDIKDVAADLSHADATSWPYGPGKVHGGVLAQFQDQVEDLTTELKHHIAAVRVTRCPRTLWHGILRPFVLRNARSPDRFTQRDAGSQESYDCGPLARRRARLLGRAVSNKPPWPCTISSLNN